VTVTELAIAPGVAAEEVDLRCPEHAPCSPGRLLARLRLAGGSPTFVQPDNLIELSCPWCKTARRRQGRPVQRVLHRYDLIGTLIETLVVE
jgi:hypothetical protein